MQINLTPDPSLLVIMAIFIVNYWIVRKFLIQPVNRVLTEREEDITSADRLYEESLARFNEATASMEERLYQARKDGSAVREALRLEAVRHRGEVIERTRREAEGIVTTASESLRGDVDAARQQIVEESERLARLAAEQIAGRKLA